MMKQLFIILLSISVIPAFAPSHPEYVGTLNDVIIFTVIGIIIAAIIIGVTIKVKRGKDKPKNSE